ncbi:vWA domain-containing protein [Flavobacterium agrisoli]|uniref:BatA and WFA domain-containing protein n=1 Tax=Flavobacterium agrisoli TaxID=2793066 RepID=A0A934PNA8_9FLAO|nr:BatA and WFA domain-containing protein [Flavobacterium agrisoli]MBK0370010.1 BatA and WFA domain-containing protein [Flavobacterium agrisoli]
MHFKNPAILYFLLVILVPILVHLFQFRRFKKSYFTNVRFLQQLVIQTRKSSKIKKWLLLATRILLLICIVLAFAQPYFEAKDNQNAANATYIILDNSFSMQAQGKKGELLKRAIQELLENVPENLTFSLLTNSENYWNTDIKSIRNELQNLKYSSSAFEIESCMAKLSAHQPQSQKDIIVITDAVGLTQKQLDQANLDSKTYFLIPEAEQKNNISIDTVFISQTLDHFYDIGIQFSAFGNDFDAIPVALYNNDKLIAKTVSNFNSNKKELHFTIPKAKFHGYVSLEDKSLPYDKRLYFSISEMPKTNVISIGQAEKATFLSRIYTSTEFNYSNFLLENLNYNLLELQDAVVLNELDEIPQALQTTLKSFVNKGGNLIVIPSEKIGIQNLNSFLGNFGKMQFKTANSSEKLITKINFDHPLFKGVFESKIANFQYPKTKLTYTVQNPYPSVLRFEDQTSFLTIIQKANTNLAVFTAPINTKNANFQQSPLIVPVFYQLAQFGKKSSISALTIGANDAFSVKTQLSKEGILEVKGTEEQFIPEQQILYNKVQMHFHDSPEIAGNYTIFNQKERLENISFNYPRTESNLTQVSTDLLRKYNTEHTISTLFNTLQTERTDNQIWKWFVIFALLFLLVEMAIIKLVK